MGKGQVKGMCVRVCVSGEDGVVGCRKRGGGRKKKISKERLTGAHVEFRGSHAVVPGWTVVKTLPILPHPLPPQKQEELGLAVYAAVVSGAH